MRVQHPAHQVPHIVPRRHVLIRIRDIAHCAETCYLLHVRFDVEEVLNLRYTYVEKTATSSEKAAAAKAISSERELTGQRSDNAIRVVGTSLGECRCLKGLKRQVVYAAEGDDRSAD